MSAFPAAACRAMFAGVVISTLAAVLPASPALAGKASFSVPLTSVTPYGGTLISVSIYLPATGTPGFFVDFILPKDYKKNTPIQVVFYFRQAGASDCAVRLFPAQLGRYRLGQPEVSGLSGLSGVNGIPLRTLPANNAFKPVIVKIKPVKLLDGQKPGDVLILALNREADLAGDTCSGTVYIRGINVVYRTNYRRKFSHFAMSPVCRAGALPLAFLRVIARIG